MNSYDKLKQSLDDENIDALKDKIRRATEDYEPPKRENGIVAIRFGTQEIDYMIMDIIDAYRKKLGYTWKTLFIRSVAELAASEKNTPLAEAIIDYMLNRKTGK